MTSGCEAAGGPRDPAFDRAVESLIRKGGPVHAEARAIDWSLAPVRPRWATERAYVEAVSQLLHAERLTGRACSRLAQAVAHGGPSLVDILTQPLHEAAAPVSEWVA